MPPLDDYLSDSEAARICGVSINTLNRFIETGYLKVENDHDGLRLFSKNELKRVFGVGESAFTKHTKINRPVVGNTATKIEESRVVAPKESALEEEVQPENVEQEKQPHLKIVRNEESPIKTELSASESMAAALPEAPPSLVQPTAQQEKSLSVQPNAELNLRISSLENDNQILEMERTKLQNVITLLEKMLEIRESEIDSLKRQQQWLETRVEKMEERSHREQLLLLAESETVRKLVVHQKRSPVRAALEWLGLAESTEPRNHIDADRG
jgi:predicted site-specific integrase-resolvase